MIQEGAILETIEMYLSSHWSTDVYKRQVEYAFSKRILTIDLSLSRPDLVLTIITPFAPVSYTHLIDAYDFIASLMQ